MCVWRGKWGDYKTHKCPFEVSEISDVGVLQFLMNSDDRLFVRLKILDSLGQRVINMRNRDINVDYVIMIYGYMKRFHMYYEIQSMCLNMLLDVASQPGGADEVFRTCDGIGEYLKRYHSNSILSEKADILLRLLPNGTNMAAGTLMKFLVRADEGNKEE